MRINLSRYSSLSGRRVLVTGSSGFIGTNLTKALVEIGAHVTGVSNSYPLPPRMTDSDFNRELQVITGDVCDRDFVRVMVSKVRPEVLFHLAAKSLVGEGFADAVRTYDVNAQGTWNLLDECRKLDCLDRVVIASSDKAYGTQQNLPYHESSPLLAVHPYELSKKIAEDVAFGYFKSFGLPVTVTRCGNVYGPFDMNLSRLIPGTIVACLRKQPVVLRGTGSEQRCYIHSSDAADAYLRLAVAPSHQVVGRPFNFGTENPVTSLHVAQSVCQIAGVDPHSIVCLGQATHEIPAQYVNSDSAKSVLGWNPIGLTLEALSSTFEWYRSNHSDK
jgi:CDP-glucose 4,6-dehydratase